MASDDFIKRFGPPTDGPPAVINTAGNNTIWTPINSSGQIRLIYLCFITPRTNTEDVIVTAQFGSRELYKIPMQAPFVWAHSFRRESEPGELFIVNIDKNQEVYVNYDLQEYRNA